MEEKGKKKEEGVSQEFLYKLGMFEKQIEQLNQQLQLVEKNMVDLDSLNFGMDDIRGSVGKDVLAQLGGGIFVKTKLISEELVVDVGNQNFVKKSIPETKKIIREQTEKLRTLKKELEDKLKEIDEEVKQLVFQQTNS